MDLEKSRVTIVGLGLIGGSMALGLSGKVGQVCGVDIKEETLQLARRRRMADQITADPSQVIPGSDLVIVALYPQMAQSFILDNLSLFSPGTLIMDVAGIKEKMVNCLQAALPEGLEFLGSHPMAGREGQGIDQAREEMFLGSNYLLTPTDKNTKEGLALAKGLVSLLGVRRIIQLSPKEHDALVAYSSQLPHLLAALLTYDPPARLEVMVGGSFRDASRVAHFNADLWTELFLENKDNLSGVLADLERDLSFFRRALETEDAAAIGNFLSQAKDHKADLEEALRKKTRQKKQGDRGDKS